MIKVAVAKTADRIAGVGAVVSALYGPENNPFKGRQVLIKPNFNTADPPPASSHNDTLLSLVDNLKKMGPAGLTVGERSFPETAQVMADKGVLPLLASRGVPVINFDELPKEDWVHFDPPGNHWPEGFSVARPIIEAESLVELCCMKTHQFGGVITMSLKLAVGVVPTSRHGFEYMSQLHSSPDQRRMIAEINLPFSPQLVVMDGQEAFVDGGPASGQMAHPGLMLASTDRVAIDAVGTAVLKMTGSNKDIMDRPIFSQEQIARAVELGLGAKGPEEIELVAVDEASQAAVAELRAILDQG